MGTSFKVRGERRSENSAKDVVPETSVTRETETDSTRRAGDGNVRPGVLERL